MWKTLLASTLVSFTLSIAFAEVAPASMPISDDSDLTGSKVRTALAIPSLELAPDAVRTLRTSGDLSLRVLRVNHGVEVEVPGVLDGFRPNCAAGARSFKFKQALTHRWIRVSQGSATPYSIVAELPCQGAIDLIFHQDTSAGQALGIWQVAENARRKLDEAIGLGFWKRPIEFAWPADGDYYSWGTVHLTRGDYWDVVGHEMGHAIYDMARLGAMGGGQHRIDECYSEALALSEGWASFFSAWVSIDLADPDARFEYMVPRRAPIQIENIPEDVCKSERNEWRVTGFFWDLLDLNDDGETGAESFARMWRALEGSRAPSARAAMERMASIGSISKELLQLIWALNRME